VSASSTSPEALSYLQSLQYVVSVSRDREVNIRETFHSTSAHTAGGASKSFPYSWGLDRIDQSSLPLDEATYSPPAGSGGGEGVNVYVIDTGIDTTHEAFANLPGSTRTVANIFNTFGDVTPNTDDYGHGSHCAGTIGGLNVGVAPRANIFGLKVFNSDGVGTTSDILRAMQAVLDIRMSDPYTPMVASMSFSDWCEGECESDPQVLAVRMLTENNIAVIASAGQSGYSNGIDACWKTPASTSTAITVGVSTQADEFAYWSNFGKCVDIVAPGEDILSVCSEGSLLCDSGTEKYVLDSGTSMAVPHVAGVTALWLSQTTLPSTAPPSVESIKQALQCTSSNALSLWDWQTQSVNKLVQVPPSTFTSVADAAMSCDRSAGCSGSADECSGNGNCLFGTCLCNGNYDGASCETLGPPSWVWYTWCCKGGELSKNTIPLNTIAFLWTDLIPSTVYYGSPSPDSFAVVFYNLGVWEENCKSTVEVVIYSTGKIEIAYVSNSVGNSCGYSPVSVGIKGRGGAGGEYEQLYGPTMTDIPQKLRVVFTPISPPSPSPVSSPTSVLKKSSPKSTTTPKAKAAIGESLPR